MSEGGFDAAFLAAGAHIAKRACIPAGAFFKKGGDGEHFRASNHALAAAAMNANLEHFDPLRRGC